jgi:serine/threonine protein kinase
LRAVVVGAKLSDFGLSNTIDAATMSLQSQCGTPVYMAPEMLQKRSYGPGVGARPTRPPPCRPPMHIATAAKVSILATDLCSAMCSLDAYRRVVARHRVLYHA